MVDDKLLKLTEERGISKIVPNCPACGCNEQVSVGKVKDSLFDELNRVLPPQFQRLPDHINVMVRCPKCDLAYLSPRLNNNFLKHIYGHWYRYGYGGTQSASDNDTARAKEFHTRHLAILKRVGGNGGKLLDVGTGTGIFVQAANSGSWDAVGIDWSEQAVEQAQRLGRQHVQICTLRDFDSPDNNFDAITMFDYLEHSQSPDDDLARASRLLKPGGLLAIRVPNYNCLQRTLTGMKWVGIFCLHLSYFNRPSLSRLLRQHGIEPVFVHAGNHQSLSMLVGKKLSWLRHRLLVSRNTPDVSSTSTFNLQPTSGLDRHPRLAAYLLGTLLELVDQAGGWFGYGQILFVVGRKLP